MRRIRRGEPRAAAASPGSLRRALAALCVTEIVSYGVIYYAFPVLAAGVAAAGLFYPPAFAALTVWYGPRRVQALTALTLAAGFASTIFAPLTSALAGQVDWREVYLILAAVLAAVTIPAHALALRPPWPPRSPRPAGHSPALPSEEKAALRSADRQVIASRAFLQLVTAATLCAFAQYAALVNLVPLLTGRGLSPGLAAWAGSYPAMFVILAAVAATGAALAGTTPAAAVIPAAAGR